MKSSHDATAATVMTLTDELYLPTRLVYEVYDAKRLRAWLSKTSCVSWNPVKLGWTWNYEGAARSLGFPPAYAKVPKAQQPVVLATAFLRDDHTFHVYTRSGFRTVKFLVFFDKQVSRSVAMGKFIDQYNLILPESPAYWVIPHFGGKGLAKCTVVSGSAMAGTQVRATRPSTGNFGSV
jgi:hypothetical protein